MLNKYEFNENTWISEHMNKGWMKSDCGGPWVPGKGNWNSLCRCWQDNAVAGCGWDALIQLTCWKAKLGKKKRAYREKRNLAICRNSENFNFQWEKQQQKSTNSFSNKNVSSLHLGIWAAVGWRDCDMLSLLYTPYSLSGSPVISVNGKNH